MYIFTPHRPLYLLPSFTVGKEASPASYRLVLDARREGDMFVTPAVKVGDKIGADGKRPLYRVYWDVEKPEDARCTNPLCGWERPARIEYVGRV